MAAPSMSTFGMRRSRARGRYQARCPRRLMSAGMSVIRMRKASMRTPAVSADPID
jgi:hypothetical protein